MSAKPICERCGQPFKQGKDDAFCNPCIKTMDAIDPVDYSRFSRDFLRDEGGQREWGEPDPLRDKKMYAFLSVFHPRLTHREKRELINK